MFLKSGLWIFVIRFSLVPAELIKPFKCGNAKNIMNECFKNSTPDILQFIGTTKIDTSEEDILNRCK